MKKINLLMIFLVTIAFVACTKDNLSRLSNSPDELVSASFALPACTPVGVPIVSSLYHLEADGAHDFAYVTLVFDGENLNFSIQWYGWNMGGFQAGEEPIDIGFYKTLPATRPSPDEFIYHFDEGELISIPIAGIVFQDGGVAESACGEQLNIVFHVDASVTVSDGQGNYVLADKSGWAGSSVNGLPDLVNWYKYIPFYPCCCTDETAWGGNSLGSGKAWWYFFDVNGPSLQNLYAGKELAGTVQMNSDNLTITLNAGWSLQPGDESVKIQGYWTSNLPLVRPSAGQFAYKGNELYIPLSEISGTPDFDYYAIHLDVQKCQ